MTARGSERNPLFRQEAMEKLGSAEELDRLMQVTSPRGWVALGALVLLVMTGIAWGVFGSIPIEIGGQQGVMMHAGARHQVVSQVGGLVTDVLVAEDDSVENGQVIAKVRLSTGQVVGVETLFSGDIDELDIQRGMLVSVGQQVAIIEQPDAELQLVTLVPIDDGKQLEPGMVVHISPSTANAEVYGYLRGQVVSVSQFPITKSEAEQLFLNQSLVDTLVTSDNQLTVTVDLAKDPATVSGFQWSSSAGPPFVISHGTLASATFVLREDRPVNLILPSSEKAR